MKPYHTIIVGGGAAGMCAAVMLRQMNPSESVLLLEALPRVGKKLIVTGNGRCNLSNAHLDERFYHGQNRSFCGPALQALNEKAAVAFFESIGLICREEENGRIYPFSFQASSVVDVFRLALEQNGVQVLCDCRVTDFCREKGGFRVQTTHGSQSAENLILAAGLYAGGEKLGSTGQIFELLTAKGYPFVRPTPAIVQIRTQTDFVRPMKGLKVNAAVTLLCDRRPVRREYGEVLFCDYGISGPPVMQVARGVGILKGELAVELDLMPELSFQEVLALLEERKKQFAVQNCEAYFTGFLPKMLGLTLLKRCRIAAASPVKLLLSGQLRELAAGLKSYRLPVTGNTGFLNAQVTAGGLDTSRFDPFTMQDRRVPGLYAIGEILDIDGDCGGYNLQWAWASAAAAARSIAGKKRDPND